mgnify:FL=1
MANPTKEHGNAALALVDYFPNRTAYYINEQSFQPVVSKLRESFLSKTSSSAPRTTGANLELLSLQLCEMFNENIHSKAAVDLTNLHRRVALSQKHRILSEATELYVKLLVAIPVPVQMEELYDHFNKATVEVQKYFDESTLNCSLTLQDYLQLCSQLGRMRH